MSFYTVQHLYPLRMIRRVNVTMTAFLKCHSFIVIFFTCVSPFVNATYPKCNNFTPGLLAFSVLRTTWIYGKAENILREWFMWLTVSFFHWWWIDFWIKVFTTVRIAPVPLTSSNLNLSATHEGFGSKWFLRIVTFSLAVLSFGPTGLH